MAARFSTRVREILLSLSRRGDIFSQALMSLDDTTPSSVAVAALPTATVDLVGHVLVVTEANQPSQVKICVPTSSGGYEWVTLQQSS